MFEYMDYIYEVYKEKNFSRAAEKLYISQSSLSLTIKHAEKKIGAEIFNRKTKPISLTDFGKLYIASCEKVRSLRTGLENYVYDMDHLHRGTLTIGAGNFYATYLLAPFIAHFKETFPNININLIEGRSSDMESLLVKGSLDMIVTNATFTSPILEKKKLFSEQLLLVVPNIFITDTQSIGSPLSKKQIREKDYDRDSNTNLDILSSIPMVGLRPGNDTRIRTEQILKDKNIRPKYLMELDQSSTAFIIASNHSGSAIIADTIIRTLWTDQDIQVFYINDTTARRYLAVYVNATRYQTRIQEYFLNAFHEYVANITSPQSSTL